jgi:hypothetical protein
MKPIWAQKIERLMKSDSFTVEAWQKWFADYKKRPKDKNVLDRGAALISEYSPGGVGAAMMPIIRRAESTSGAQPSDTAAVLNHFLDTHKDHPKAKIISTELSHSTIPETTSKKLAEIPTLPKPGWLHTDHPLSKLDLHTILDNLSPDDQVTQKSVAKTLVGEHGASPRIFADYAHKYHNPLLAAEAMPFAPSDDVRNQLVRAVPPNMWLTYSIVNAAKEGKIGPEELAGHFAHTHSQNPEQAEKMADLMDHGNTHPAHMQAIAEKVSNTPEILTSHKENLPASIARHLPADWYSRQLAEDPSNHQIAHHFKAFHGNEFKQMNENLNNVITNPSSKKKDIASAIKTIGSSGSPFAPSAASLAMLRGNPANQKAYEKLLLSTIRKSKTDDPTINLKHDLRHEQNNSVDVAIGTGKLRQARDLAEHNGGAAHVSAFRNAGLDPAGLKIEHLKDNKGHIAASKIQEAIDNTPKMKFGVSRGKYTNDVQRHDLKQPSKVFRLEISPETKNKLNESGLMPIYEKIQEISKKSGHPTTDDTLGWVRYTNTPSDVHIDEIQSDFGQTLSRHIEDAIKKDPESADQFAKQGLTLDSIHKMNDVLFQGVHPSQVIHEGFLQSLRNSGNVGKNVHIWQSEPRAELSGLKTTPDMDWKKAGDLSIYADLSKYPNGQPPEDYFKMLTNSAMPFETSTDIFSKMNPHLSKENVDKIVKDNPALAAKHLGDNPHFSKEHVDKIVDDRPLIAAKYLANNPHLNAEHISKILGHDAGSTVRYLRNNPNFNQEHFNHTIVGLGVDEALGILHNTPYFTKEHMNEMVANSPEIVATADGMTNNPYFTKEHFDSIIKNRPHLKKYLADSPYFTKEHIDDYVNADPTTAALNFKDSPLLSKEHIDRIVEQSPNTAAKYLHSHPNLTKEHVDSIVERKPASAAEYLANNSHLNAEHIDDIITYAAESAARHLHSNPHLNAEHISRIVERAPVAAASFLHNNPHFTKEHAAEAIDRDERAEAQLRDPIPYVSVPGDQTPFFSQIRVNPETSELTALGHPVTLKKPKLPVHIREGYGDIPKKMGYKPAKYGDLVTQTNPEHNNEPTWAQKLTKSLAKRRAKK